MIQCHELVKDKIQLLNYCICNCSKNEEVDNTMSVNDKTQSHVLHVERQFILIFCTIVNNLVVVRTSYYTCLLMEMNIFSFIENVT